MPNLQHTRGIVLKTVKYSETSVVAKVYTEKLGIQSYIINGVRSSKSKTKLGLLQPLSLLEMEVYYRENKSLNRIKEMKLAHTFSSIPFQVSKSALALFMTEILYKTLKEEEANKDQFAFIFESVKYLDQTEASISNLHLSFMVKLSRYLGFHPQNNFFYSDCSIFDLQEGVFTHRIPDTHLQYIELPLSEKLSKLIHLSLTNAHELSLVREQRQALLACIIRFYELHVAGFKEVKSLKVLQEVLR